MPQFELAVFSSQIFWLVIFFTILMVYTVKISVPRMRDILDERWQRTDGFKIAADRFQSEAQVIFTGNDKDISEAKIKAHSLMSEKIFLISSDAAQKKKIFHGGYLKNVEKAEAELKKSLERISADVEQDTIKVTQLIIGKIMGFDASEIDIQKHMNNNIKVMVANGD